LPPEFISKTDHTEGISVLRKIGSEIIKAFGLWIPTHDQSQTKGLPLDAPFHCELSALLFGKLRGDGLKIAILARLDALPVFTISLDDTGIHYRTVFHL
jgi:hypothetical protein